jgi:hypothetical protein
MKFRKWKLNDQKKAVFTQQCSRRKLVPGSVYNIHRENWCWLVTVLSSSRKLGLFLWDTL